MKIYMTKAALLLLISGSTDAFSAPNNSVPNKGNSKSDKPEEHVSDLRRLGNTPQPSAFKAKIPFLHGMEAPSATAPLIPKRNTFDPMHDGAPMGPPMHGAPMGHPMGGPMGHPMGGPMGGPMDGPMGGPMGHPMLGPPPGHPMHGPPPGHPMHGPPGAGDGRWGMPDMLRGAPGSNDPNHECYDHPMQGDGDGYWQSKYGDNMQAAHNPFSIPYEFLDAPVDPYGSARSEYKPMFPEGENPYEEIGGPGYERKVKKPNTRQEKKPNMPRMEEYRQEQQPNTQQQQQPNMHREQQSNMYQELQPDTHIPPMEEHHNAQHASAGMHMDNYPRPSESHPMPPMDEYVYSDQGHDGRYGEPFHHQEQAPQGNLQEMYEEQFRHQEQAPQENNGNVWPYNVSPPLPILDLYEGNGYVSVEDPNMVRHPPMNGNEFAPMGDPNMMNQGPMRGHEFVPMGDPNMMMSRHGGPIMNDHEFDRMQDPNMMGPPHGYPMNDYHPMDGFSPPMGEYGPPMEEYGMYNDPYAHGPVYAPEPMHAPEPVFYQDQHQPPPQDEWYRQQSGLDRGHHSF